MASCLYFLKIFWYHVQFETTPQNIAHAEILAEYKALLHASDFLKSPMAVSEATIKIFGWMCKHNNSALMKEVSNMTYWMQ